MQLLCSVFLFSFLALRACVCAPWQKRPLGIAFVDVVSLRVPSIEESETKDSGKEVHL